MRRPARLGRGRRRPWLGSLSTRPPRGNRAISRPARAPLSPPQRHQLARRDRMLPMTASQLNPADALLAARERWTARGVSAPAIVATRAEGSYVVAAAGSR